MYNDLSDTDLEYVWFDFHGECKKMKWENLSKLVSICEEQIHDWGSFAGEVKGSNAKDRMIIAHQRQTGVFRTNCMDCLDRTNVV